MRKEELKRQIELCHNSGRKIAVSFCSHVPQEILEAAGFCCVRLPVIEETLDAYPGMLPKNVCPTVRSCCAICEDASLDDVDLILTESTCDGKKKMYELLTNQERLYYYQVVQGVERDYSKRLILSELRHLLKMLKERFGIEVTDEELRKACEKLNAERQSKTELLEIQRTCPPPVTGMRLYAEVEKNQAIFDREERIEANRKSRERLLAEAEEISKKKKRILITGCPLGSVYRKIVHAAEENGGVVVCFENCEMMKSSLHHVDTGTEDIIDALAECYLNSSCAIMEQNSLRFEQLENLTEEYQIDGVIDVSLTTCHPYSSEKYKVQRFLENLGIPCFALETIDNSSDVGQIETRIGAFIEML